MRAQFARLPPAQELADHGALGVGLAPGPGAPLHAHDGALFQQRQVERHPGDLAAREADDEQAAAGAQRAQGRLAQVAADRVVDDVDAAERPERLAQIGLRIVDGLVGALAPAEFELLVGRRGGDDARAELLGDLQGREPHAAGGAEHEHGLAGAQGGAVHERVVGGAVRVEKAGGDLEGHFVGQAKALLGGGDDPLGEAAEADEGHDAVADARTLGALADRRHHARDLAAGREGQGRLELVEVLNREQIGEVHPRRLDVENELAPPRHRPFDLAPGEFGGGAEALTHDRAHRPVFLAAAARVKRRRPPRAGIARPPRAARPPALTARPGRARVVALGRPRHGRPPAPGGAPARGRGRRNNAGAGAVRRERARRRAHGVRRSCTN